MKSYFIVVLVFLLKLSGVYSACLLNNALCSNTSIIGASPNSPGLVPSFDCSLYNNVECQLVTDDIGCEYTQRPTEPSGEIFLPNSCDEECFDPCIKYVKESKPELKPLCKTLPNGTIPLPGGIQTQRENYGCSCVVVCNRPN